MKRRPLIFVGSRQMMRELAVIAELNDIEVLGILDHHYPDQIAGDLSVIGDERTLLDPDNKQAQQWLRTCNFFPGNWHNGEQALYYSDNCFGTADAISFKKNFLRIHDLKTGVTPGSMKQLLIYASMFCLEYNFLPIQIFYDFPSSIFVE